MRSLASKEIPQEILADITPETREKLLHDHPSVWLQVMALRHRVWADAADRGYDRPSATRATDDHAERRFIEGVPILDLDEWRQRFAAGNP